MKKTIEDDILPDGINSVLLASADGELHNGWELRSQHGVFIGITIDELVDSISKSGLHVNAILLTALLVQLEMDGLEMLVEEDEETLLAC